MSAWILWCVSVIAFSSLAASMSKHQRDIFIGKVSPQKTRLLQIFGWSILLLSVVVVIFWRGASIGLSEWLGCLTFAALMVGLTLTYFPKKLAQFNMAIGGILVVLSIIVLS